MSTSGSYYPPAPVPDPPRRVFAGVAATDVDGNAVFTFTPAFAGVPVVTFGVAVGTTDLTDVRITALSAGSVTVNVRASAPVTVGDDQYLTPPVPLEGATVHAHATAAGQT